MTAEPLKILICAAEAVPFAKVGGLADVAGALPLALKEMGHDVRLALPGYGQIDRAQFGLAPLLEAFPVPLDQHTEPVEILQATIGAGVPVYFTANERYFNRENIYSYPDDDERFILYCRAALEMLKRIDWKPDVIHLNDWQTAIIANWLKTIYRDDPFFADTATVYTIHNLAYQGVFGHRVLEIAGIAEHGYIHHPQIAELTNVVDLMARGIIYADMVTTVSERYAQEIQTPEYGEKLDPLLRDRAETLTGIVNGIDIELMNPATDKYIAATFDVNSLEQRPLNKVDLQRAAGLPELPEVPVIGVISRLTNQKGFDILGPLMDAMLTHLDLQFILLGTGDQYYHEMFMHVAEQHPLKASIFLTFNASLAQKIYAGSDMFLMPSRFEPCGLGQMIAMHYGSIPIVRRTGGLADTVQDFDPRTGTGTGFVFEAYDSMALFASIVRALETHKYRDVWKQLMARDMQLDFSWRASAHKYVEVYRRAQEIRERGEPVGMGR